MPSLSVKIHNVIQHFDFLEESQLKEIHYNINNRYLINVEKVILEMSTGKDEAMEVSKGHHLEEDRNCITKVLV